MYACVFMSAWMSQDLRMVPLPVAGEYACVCVCACVYVCNVSVYTDALYTCVDGRGPAHGVFACDW